MADDMGDKTEAPSSHKLTQARERGNLPKSVDLSGSIDLLGAVLLIWLLGPMLVAGCAEVMRRLLGASDPTELINQDSTIRVFLWSMTKMVTIAAPIMLSLLVVAAVAQIQQVKLVFSLEPLMPKLERLNPMAGLGRLFARRNLVKTITAIVKLGVVGTVVVLVVKSRSAELVALPALGAIAGFKVMLEIIFHVSLWTLGVMIAIGVCDWSYQKWQHMQDLKMTKHEVKEERKMMDGDPEVKSKRAKVARDIATQRARNAVPKADVVVTNPTHYAVALKYDADRMAAPIVLAKGEDFMAMRIREIASQHGVPIVERPALARALYAGVRVGQVVKTELFEAVAEVLAYVYRLEKRKAG